MNLRAAARLYSSHNNHFVMIQDSLINTISERGCTKSHVEDILLCLQSIFICIFLVLFITIALLVICILIILILIFFFISLHLARIIITFLEH